MITNEEKNIINMWLEEGKSIARIARELGRDPKTVRAHMEKSHLGIFKQQPSSGDLHKYVLLLHKEINEISNICARVNNLIQSFYNDVDKEKKYSSHDSYRKSLIEKYTQHGPRETANKHAGQDKLIGTIQAAKLLGVSRGTIYTLIKKGTLKSIQLGRRILLRASDINKIVQGTKEEINQMAKGANNDSTGEEKQGS